MSHKAKRDDAAVLKELKERFTYAEDKWRKIREEGQKDIRYVAGDPWDPKERKSRDDAGRPCISIDEINQYVNQLINDVRQNKRAIKVSPRGSGANEKTATLRANKIREIEYRSHAQMVYTTTFENAVQRSYGFHRVNTKFVRDSADSQPQTDAFDQELWIEPIVNPDLVIPDPDHLRPDGSDMSYAFVYESRTVEEFERDFPEAKVTDFASEDLQKEAGSWLQGNRVRIAEYWAVEKTYRKLLLLKPPPDKEGAQPIAVWADTLEEMPPKEEIDRARDVEIPKVMMYLTNGVEILETTAWPGKYIPLICCYGKVLYVDEGSGAERRLMSMVRLARDPQMLMAYLVSCEAELVGQTPKVPYITYAGQVSQAQANQIAKSMHEPVSHLEFEPTIPDKTNQTILPLPQRQPYDPPIAPLEILKESTRRGLQAAIGSTPLPSEAQKRNEKSGIALKQIEQTAQKGSFHFVDHYEDAIRFTGVVLNDLIPHVVDTERDITVRKIDDTVQNLRANSSPDTDFKNGDHEVTLSTGQKFDDEREQASEFADMLIANIKNLPVQPQQAAALLAMAIRLKNGGPLIDEMADIIHPRPSQDGQMDPQAMQQALQQKDAELKELMQSAQGMKQALETDQMKQQAQIEKAKIEARRDIQLQQMRDRNALIIKQFEATSKLVLQDDQQAHELGMAGAQAQAQIDAAAASFQQQMAMAESGQGHEFAMGERGHEQGLESAEQQGVIASQQAEQQAALNPPAQAGA